MSAEKDESHLYADLFLIEANLTAFPSFTAPAETDPSSVYGKISYGSSVYCSREKKEKTSPVWNEDCTFILPENVTNIEGEHLNFSLFHRTPGRVWSYSDSCKGKCKVNLFSQPLGTMIEMCLSLIPVLEVEEQNRSKERLAIDLQEKEAMVRIVLYLSKTQEEGILSAYGKPMHSIPIRMAPGDLLLVSTTEWSGLGVQTVTRSKWDHVAMVIALRSNPSAYRLFEVSQEGVEFYALDHTLDFYLSGGCTIGVRRLKINRTEPMLEALYTFAEEARGKPYKRDYMQIVRSLFRTNQVDDKSSFFCSQLIAAAYQKMGILKDEIPSNNYLPCHFEESISEHLTVGELDGLICFKYEPRSQK